MVAPIPGPDRAKDVSALQLLAEVLRRWRLVIGLPLAVAVAATAVSLMLPRRYAATVTFTPETRANRAGLIPAMVGGLAGQLLGGLGGDLGEGPRFYAQVVGSRSILESVLLTPYPDSSSGVTMMTALFRVQGRTHADSLADGVRQMQDRVSTSVDLTTNLVTVSAEAPTAELAAAVANRLVALLNQFNAERRQSRAHERRRFVEGRLAASSEELRAAESAVKSFLQRNRSYEQSPELQFEYQALQRRVNSAQEVYLTLLREFETSRIEEVNDTPVLTVIDAAVPPRRKSRPRRMLIVLLSTAVAGAASLLLAAMANYITDARSTGAPDFVRMHESWAAVRSELTAMVGRATSRRGPPAA